MSPKQVVHLATIGQTFRFLRGYGRALRRRGYQLFLISDGDLDLQASAQAEECECVGIRMERRITPFADLLAIVRLCLALSRLRPQIVHAHTPKAGMVGMIAGFVARVPVRLYHVHGAPIETARGVSWLCLWLSDFLACSLATRVYCVSASVADVVKHLRVVRAAKVTVLGEGTINGIDAQLRFNPSMLPPGTRQRVRDELGVPGSAVLLGFVGRLVLDKGITELVQAWRLLGAKYQDIHLLVVGMQEAHSPLPPSLWDSLVSDPRVHFVGCVWETSPLYEAMDVVVLPTYREGFPTVALEAAAMAKPIVATRVTGCVDAVVDGSTGYLVKPRDPVALADAIARYVDCDELRLRHGGAARLRVMEKFRPDKVRDALCDEYQRLL